ncbi:MAG: DUF47 family protein [Proteobacteria bacterium]|nr:DUF47 family protein [Pseudomonadota bacterium]
MQAFSFLPKQEKFYTYLTELSAKADVCAHHLKSYIEAPDTAARTRISREIADCRAQSKKIMSDLTGELCRSFITPFDREDIQHFAQCLYRIPKMIEKSTQRMELHGLKGAPADFLRQIVLIVDEAEVMEGMVSDLINRRNTQQVVQKVSRLHELEQKGDDIFQDLLSGLFAEGRDVKDLLLRKDIYDLLEKVIDCYRDAAAVTLQIVLKYS